MSQPLPHSLPAFEPAAPWLISDMDEEEAALTVGLGVLVREAAAFEYTLHGLAAHLLNEPLAYGYKKAKQPTAEQIDACLHELPSHPDIPAASRLALAHDLELSKKHLKERHRFVHGCWAYDHDRQSWRTVKDSRGKGSTRPEHELASASEIWEVAAEFSRLDAKLTAWDATYFGEVRDPEEGEPGWMSVKRL